MKKDEVKDLFKAFLLAVAFCSAIICAINPQMFRDILSWIRF
jgi:hypothetical protein